MNCKCLEHPPPNVLPLMLQNKIIMTVLNRKPATCEGGGIFKNWGLCEKAKGGGFTSKGVSVTQQTSGEWGVGAGAGWGRSLGTASRDKCETKRASPGPISSVIGDGTQVFCVKYKDSSETRRLLTNGAPTLRCALSLPRLTARPRELCMCAGANPW